MQLDVVERAKKIKLLLMDCDGVLTDGKLYFTEAGETMKVFHVRDGQGLSMWHRAGFESGIISGRNSKVVSIRSAELGINFVKVGCNNKLTEFAEILVESSVGLDEIAYVGDDLPDIDLMKKVGLAIAVADAAQEVFLYAHHTTLTKGGEGAIREITDLLLNAKGLIV